MTKQEKKIIQKALADIMEGGDNYCQAIAAICRLVGWTYPAGELTETKKITIPEVMKHIG